MTSSRKIKIETLRLATLVMLVFSLLLLLSGITFAVYKRFMKGSTNNIIEAGVISFSYDEGVFQGNGVNIEDAWPMSDERGMSLKSSNQYFDFSVSAHTTIADIYYEIVLLKQDTSTLDDRFVKAYVTERNGNIEQASSMVMDNGRVKKFQELESVDTNGKLVYTAVVKKGINYYQDFRLRLWLSDDIKHDDDFYNKTFSIKVKVNAKEV